jgi:hypothetical protein
MMPTKSYPIPLKRLEHGNFTSLVDPGEPGYEQYKSLSESARWSITPDEGDILAMLAKDKRVCEIGTGLGISTVYLASSANHVATIDVDPWVQENIFPWLLSIENMGCLIRAYGGRALVDTYFDLFFIDGLHVFEAVEADLEWCLDHSNGPADILLHDLCWIEVAFAARRFTTKHPEYSIRVLDTPNKVGLITHRRSGIDGIFDMAVPR